MEHHINAPGDGVVREIYVEAGQQVDNGATLAAARGRRARPTRR